MEYVEHEDEFDIHPIEEIHKRRLDLEDEAVDVLTVEPSKGEADEEAFRMPVLLDMDDSESDDEIVAIGPGTMRRKSPGQGRDWMNGAASGESGDDRSNARRAPTNGIVKSQSRTRKR